MTRSVSTFGRSIGRPTAVTRVNGSIQIPSVRTSVSLPVTAAAAAIAGHIRCVRAPWPWRPSKLRFDVDATRSPAAAVSPFMPDAHRAARLAPLEARVDEDAVEALGLGGALDQARARHDPRRHDRAAALRDARRRAQVVEPAVRARADEDAVDGDVAERRARRRAPCRPARASCSRDVRARRPPPGRARAR